MHQRLKDFFKDIFQRLSFLIPFTISFHIFICFIDPFLVLCSYSISFYIFYILAFKPQYFYLYIYRPQAFNKDSLAKGEISYHDIT